MIMKRICILFLTIFSCAVLGAQEKGNIPMNVPDSLLHFDYQFDYSVFESPYKGAYEFSPYYVQMDPSRSVYDGKKLFLRAGAGYSLHPELDFYWTPVREDSYSLSVYNTGRGYKGKYTYAPDGIEYSAHDFSDELGLDARFINRNSYVSVRGGWNGIFSSTPDWIRGKSAFNSFFAGVGVKARNDNPSFFYYDFNLKYRYAGDNYEGVGSLVENNISVFGSVGPVVKRNFRFLVDFDVDFDKLRDGRRFLYEDSAGTASASGSSSDAVAVLISGTPHLKFSLGPVSLDAGVKLDLGKAASSKFTLSPVVTASADIVKDRLKMYAGFVGGQNLNTYGEMKQMNHFHFRETESLEVTRTRFDAFVGFKGTAGAHFDYDIKGGYKSVENAPVAYMTYVFADVTKFYVNAAAAWHSDNIDVDANLHFVPKSTIEEGSFGLSSPVFQGDVRAVYNWNKRIYAGVWMQMMTDRKSHDPAFSQIKGFFSPGLYAEYKLNGILGVWAQAGNLLGQAVYTTPGYVVKGPYFTIGVSCNL